MLNQTQSELVYKWSIDKANHDELILMFICAPICIIGFFLCLLNACILNEFKETIYVYLKIESFLMAIDLAIIAARSYMAMYMCVWEHKPCPQPPSSFMESIRVYVFIYLPSPLEACVLVTGILTALNGIYRVSHRRSRFKQLIVSSNPFKAISLSFAFFSLLFLYQVYYYSDSNFKSEGGFFHTYWKYFELGAFILRDGFLLGVLLGLNVIILREMRSSFRRKLSILNGVAVSHARKSRSKISLLILTSSANTTLGRLPLLILFVLASSLPSSSRPSYIPYLTAISFTTLSISYFLKFFIFFYFNKRFRLIFFKMFHLSKFCVPS